MLQYGCLARGKSFVIESKVQGPGQNGWCRSHVSSAGGGKGFDGCWSMILGNVGRGILDGGGIGIGGGFSYAGDGT